jgi:hypothetical protein
MADFEIAVDLRSALAAMEKVSPAQVERRTRNAMEESLSWAQSEVRAGMVVDTGLGRGSVVTEMRGAGVDVRGRVYSPLAHVVVMERGRRPGAAMPPLAPIRRWLERHGMDGGLAFVVARNIARKGMPAHRMFERAVEKGRGVIPGIFARHFRI